jgi:hypothetical protein
MILNIIIISFFSWRIIMKNFLLAMLVISLTNHYAHAKDSYIHDSFSSGSLSGWQVFDNTSDKANISAENSTLRIIAQGSSQNFAFAGVKKVITPTTDLSLSVVMQGDFSILSGKNSRAYVAISNEDESESLQVYIGRDGNDVWTSQVCTVGGCTAPTGKYINMSKARVTIIKMDSMLKISVNGEPIYSESTSIQKIGKIILGGGGANNKQPFSVYFNEFSLHSI